MRTLSLRLAFWLLSGVGIVEASPSAEGAISGLVKDFSTGNPLVGAKVSIFEVKSTRPIPFSDTLLTGADGSFRFAGLAVPSGMGYEIHAWLDRYWDSYVTVPGLAGGEEKQIEVRCGKIFAVKIQVRDASAPLQPLQGAHVLMNPARWYRTGVNGITDGQGEIGFKDLTPGAVGLTVAKEGFRSSFVRDTLGAVWDDTLRILLERAADGEAKTIAGELRFASGKAIAGSPVLFGCRAPDDGSLFFGSSVADGGFSITGIPAVCERGVLLSQFGADSVRVELPTGETRKDFVLPDPPPPLQVPAKAKPSGRGRDLPWFRNFTLLGRWRGR